MRFESLRNKAVRLRYKQYTVLIQGWRPKKKTITDSSITVNKAPQKFRYSTTAFTFFKSESSRDLYENCICVKGRYISLYKYIMSTQKSF